jgi:hypothetical protein
MPREAQDVVREAIELCLKEGALDVVVMVSMGEGETVGRARSESYFAGFSGRGLSVRGLLEMGMESIRNSVRTR